MTHRFNLVALTLLLVPACNKEGAASAEGTSGKSASAESAPAAAKAGTAPPSAATAVEAKAAAPTTVGVTSATIIEAGCSYDGTRLKGNEGDIFQVSCPAGCEKGQPTWGTGTYSAHSAICTSCGWHLVSGLVHGSIQNRRSAACAQLTTTRDASNRRMAVGSTIPRPTAD